MVYSPDTSCTALTSRVLTRRDRASHLQGGVIHFSTFALASSLADAFERGGVGFQVGVSDLAVELDDALQFGDRLVPLPAAAVDHRHVVPGDSFTGTVADLAGDGQGLVVVLQGLLGLAQPVVDADVGEGGGFVAAITNGSVQPKCLLSVRSGAAPSARV